MWGMEVRYAVPHYSLKNIPRKITIKRNAKMKILNLKNIGSKDLIVFDLDGTLVRTKSPMDVEMSELVARLLLVKRVVVIGGGKYSVFQELLVRQLKCSKESLKNLFLFPTTATAFYKYERGWKRVYSFSLTPFEISQIRKAFYEVFKEIGYQHPKKTYGELIENRGGSQMAFSVYGQDIVRVLGDKGVKMKEEWLKNNLKTKMKITREVQKKLPNLEVRAAGFTTIDVTKKGIDKAFGIRQFKKYLKVPVNKMLFIGDAMFPGGNDYPVIKTGVDYMTVKNPEETKNIIR